MNITISQYTMKVKTIFKTIYDKAQDLDKIVHFICGFALSLFFGIIDGFLIGIIAGIVADLLKEFWNKKHHATIDVWDFAFTAFGAIIASPFALFFYKIVHHVTS